MAASVFFFTTVRRLAFDCTIIVKYSPAFIDSESQMRTPTHGKSCGRNPLTRSTIFFRAGRLKTRNEPVLLEQSGAIATFSQRVDLDGWWLPVWLCNDGR